MPVELDDVIEIPADGWPEPIVVNWQQSMKPKNGKYRKVTFTNTRAGESEVQKDLFVAEESIDALKKAGKQNGSKITLTVSKDFVYGQGKDKKNRWLVYHDKKREIFQHRFASAMLEQIAEVATKALAAMGFYDFKPFTDVVSSLVGDKLKEFK